MAYTIYTSPGFPECAQAKALLARNGIKFDEIKVPAPKTDKQEAALTRAARTKYADARRNFMIACGVFGWDTEVPFIVVTGTVIGGYAELVDWINDGKHTHSAEFLAKKGYIGQRRADNPRPGFKQKDPKPPRMSDRLP